MRDLSFLKENNDAYKGCLIRKQHGLALLKSKKIARVDEAMRTP